MTIDTENLLNSIIESLGRISYIKPRDIPNIDMYMDQVTTFMDSKLKPSTRFPDEDKILTKTMINNYAKNDLLPPPVKKKYSREHIYILILIYYAKNILSINDIQTMLAPLTDNYFDGTGSIDFQKIYTEVFQLEPSEIEKLKNDITEKFGVAKDTFTEVEDEEERDLLQIFSLITLLGIDVYVKKLLIEKLLDGFFKPKMDEKEAAEKKEKSEKKAEKKAEKKEK